MGPSPDIRFDGWTYRASTGELARDGCTIRLQKHPAQVLEALLASPAELVTREALISRLWPKGVVEFDTALNTAVHRLRTALGDPADSPRYIETIPRRGYRFIGSLDDSVPVALPDAGRAARTAVIESPRAGRYRWRTAAVVLVIGLAIAGTLASGPGSGTIADEAPAVADATKAQEAFERAEYFFQRRADGDLERARESFEEALAADPGLSRAHAGLASVYWIETVEGHVPPEQGLSRLRDAAERALALDPDLAEAHLRLANYRSALREFDKAREHAKIALSLEPDNSLVLAIAAGFEAQAGRLDRAIEMQQKSVAAAPLSKVGRYNLAWLLFMAGRFEESERELRRLQELHPSLPASADLYAQVALAQSRFQEALEWAARIPDEPERQQALAMAYHGLGRHAEADAALKTLVDSYGEKDPLRIAEVYAFRDEPDRAFEWLEAGTVADGEPPWARSGRQELWWMPRSPFLASLHADRRWREWVAAAGRIG